jgi:hypothetical protein
VVESIAQNPSHSLLDLADVHQHPCRRVDRAGKNEIGDVISPGPVTGGSLGSKRGQILRVRPFFDKQAAGGGKFDPLADG